MTNQPPPTPQTIDPIAAGDQLARQGDWYEAINVWQQAAEHDALLREPVKRRLTWLLEEWEGRSDGWLSRTVRLVLGSAITALLGTLLVLVADEPGTPAANILAVAAWVLFIASATMAVVAARGEPGADIDDLLRSARATAYRVDIHDREEPRR